MVEYIISKINTLWRYKLIESYILRVIYIKAKFISKKHINSWIIIISN